MNAKQRALQERVHSEVQHVALDLGERCNRLGLDEDSTVLAVLAWQPGGAFAACACDPRQEGVADIRKVLRDLADDLEQRDANLVAYRMSES